MTWHSLWQTRPNGSGAIFKDKFCGIKVIIISIPAVTTFPAVTTAGVYRWSEKNNKQSCLYHFIWLESIYFELHQSIFRSFDFDFAPPINFFCIKFKYVNWRNLNIGDYNFINLTLWSKISLRSQGVLRSVTTEFIKGKS